MGANSSRPPVFVGQGHARRHLSWLEEDGPQKFISGCNLKLLGVVVRVEVSPQLVHGATRWPRSPFPHSAAQGLVTAKARKCYLCHVLCGAVFVWIVLKKMSNFSFFFPLQIRTDITMQLSLSPTSSMTLGTKGKPQKNSDTWAKRLKTW